MKYVLLFIVLGACTSATLADAVYLNDGTKMDGDVKKSGDGWVVTLPSGKKTHLNADQIKKIELSRQDADTGNADERLASLRRSTEFSTDLNDVINRYQRFIEQNAGTKSAGDALKDLATWRDRRDRALVKFGPKWVTPEERAALLATEIGQVENARQLIKQGRMKEADQIVTQILNDNPQSASALYLRGLLSFQRDDMPAARKSMDSVNAIVPNHPPTLNDLGVIAWRQNQQMAALNYYDQAMLSLPTDETIVNNVGEALHALAPKDRNNAIAKRVQRRFAEADAKMQAEKSKQGLHRWGSQWVDDVELARLQKAEKDVRDQLDDLADRYSAIESRIARIDDDIESNNRTLRQIEARSYYQDPNTGRVYRTALPSTYYDIQDDNTHLQQDRERQVAKLGEMKQQAKALQRNLPIPQFTGLQKMIGAEGTPIAIIAAPATQPAAAAPPAPVAAAPDAPATQPATAPAR